MTNIKFNEKLTELLKKNNMSQKELAERLNVTEATVSRYIKGEREPNLNVVAQIANIFKVSLEELTGAELEASVADYSQVKNLVARNASRLTNEQKKELLDIINGL